MMPTRRLALIGIACLSIISTANLAAYLIFVREKEWVEPHLADLGPFHRQVTTSSPDSQRYFDQGLAFLADFNYLEAERSFHAAAKADPQSAMALWGLAMAQGPNINKPAVDPESEIEGWKAARVAVELSSHCTSVERALIDAIATRYSEDAAVDRHALDDNYARRMCRVWKEHPEDADIGVWAAEALLDLHPWDQWETDGKPKADTQQIIQILETVLANSPEHPLALHLYIHTLEASPHPEKGDMAAQRLRELTLGLGHLCHMPSHLDIRRGRWKQAVLSNEKAITADAEYCRVFGLSDAYTSSMVHNLHMLAYAYSMQGQSENARRSIERLLATIPARATQIEIPSIDGYFAMPYENHLRFGHWDAMLAEPKPAPVMPIATAVWHYGRGVAFAAKSQTDSAIVAQQEFLAAESAVPKNALIRRTPAFDFLGIAEKMLDGEILYRTGNLEGAVATLRQSVEREDRILYHEPPLWLIPVRHALGAILMDAGRYADAESVYRQDLERHPENGWSLYGLSRSLILQGKTDESASVTARFQKAWQFADVPLKSSCFCVRQKK